LFGKKLYVDDLDTQDTLLNYLHIILCKDKYDDEVTMESFCHFISWFAPLYPDNNYESFFNRIKDIFSKKYFHMHLSENKAYQYLKKRWNSSMIKKNYFLVRLSMSDIGEFILSYIDNKGDAHHIKIINYDGRLWVEQLEVIVNGCINMTSTNISVDLSTYNLDQISNGEKKVLIQSKSGCLNASNPPPCINAIGNSNSSAIFILFSPETVMMEEVFKSKTTHGYRRKKR